MSADSGSAAATAPPAPTDAEAAAATAATAVATAVSARGALALLALAAALSLPLSLAVGSTALSPSAIWQALHGAESAAATVLFDLRLPRALAAFAAGGLLALAGALLQGLLRNPLADPYVLGISGGAAVAALLALAAGATGWLTQLASALGAAGALALLFLLARRALIGRDLRAGDDASTAVLLTGVMIAALAAAVLALLLALAPDGRLRSMMFWLLGDLSAATDRPAALAACAVLLVATLWALRHARALNLLLRGDVQALTQGVPVARLRRVVIVLAALATGCAVTLGGAIGFVGFVAPHLVRLVVGNDQRLVLPAAVLGGGTLVVLADTLARTIVAPLQLPVGVVTALVGVPVFLWLMRGR